MKILLEFQTEWEPATEEDQKVAGVGDLTLLRMDGFCSNGGYVVQTTIDSYRRMYQIDDPAFLHPNPPPIQGDMPADGIIYRGLMRVNSHGLVSVGYYTSIDMAKEAVENYMIEYIGKNPLIKVVKQ